MNKILFPAKIQNLYSADYQYLQDNTELEIKKIFRQFIQNPGIPSILKGFNLAVSTSDSSKIMIYHDGGWGGLVSQNDDIIETQDIIDLIEPSDETVGVENYVYIRLYRVQGTYNKQSELVEEDVQRNIDLYDYTKIYDRGIDKWEVHVYTQSEVASLTPTEVAELVLLGSFTANGGNPITNISETGRVYSRSYIQKNSITTEMLALDDLFLPQENVEPSEVIDDNFEDTPIDLQEDLNQIRTIIRKIKGTFTWDEETQNSLADTDSSANKLHGNGVIRNEWDELEVVPNSTGLSVIVKGGKALVEGDVSHVLPQSPVVLTLDPQEVFTVGNWDTKVGEEHVVGTPPTSFALNYKNIGNLKITDKFNEPYPNGFTEDVDYTVDYINGIISIPNGSRISNETVKCYYVWGYDRYDIVEIGEANTVQINKGESIPDADPPSPTARFLALFQIKIRPLDTTIPSESISDIRAYAQNVRNLKEILSSAISIQKNIVNAITYITSSGDVDESYDQWELSTFNNKNIAKTSTGGAQFLTTASTIEGDELWLMADKTPWTNTIMVEWESEPHSEIYDQSTILDLSERDYIEYCPIHVASGLSRGFHRVRVTVIEIENTFTFYSVLVGRLDTLYSYNLLYGRPDTEEFKVTHLRGEYSRLYVEDPSTPRKARFYIDDNKEISTSTGYDYNYWDAEQIFPVSRLDQKRETGGPGTPRTIDDWDEETEIIPEGPINTRTIIYFTPSSDLLHSEFHQRVGVKITNPIPSSTGDLRVILHDSSHNQIGSISDKPEDELVSGWNYVELEAELIPGNEYHYHIFVVGRAGGTSPTLETDGSDEIYFRELYKPRSGLYKSTNGINFLEKGGSTLVTERTSTGDAEGSRYDVGVLDVLGVDLSNDTIWDTWEYEDYIGIDVKTGRIKFPSGYDARDYYIEINLKDPITRIDAKSILRHGETRSVEDQLRDLEHDSQLLTLESDGVVSPGDIAYLATTGKLGKFIIGSATNFTKIIGICHSVPEVNKLDKDDPINLCLKGLVNLTLASTSGWTVGDPVYVRNDGDLISQAAAEVEDWYDIKRLGIIQYIKTNQYLRLLVT